MGFTALIQGHSGHYTTPLFWDCRCEEDYIHPASHESCTACNTRREEAPDARVDEVFRHAYAFRLPIDLVNAVAAAAEAVDPALTEGMLIPF